MTRRKKPEVRQEGRIKSLGKNIGWAFLILTLLILGAVQVLVTIKFADKGKELAELQVKAAAVSQENAELLRVISEKNSLVIISSRSADLGLTKPESVVYLTEQIPVAQAPLAQ